MRHSAIKSRNIAANSDQQKGDLGKSCGLIDREEDEKGKKFEREEMGERRKEAI